MGEMTIVNVPISRELKDKLEALARDTNRSESFLAAQAISAYVETNAWQVEGIKKALEEADRGGPFVPHDEVGAWVRSWDTDHERPRPKPSIKT